MGWIPQVESTYAYWEGNYPLINEKGVGFGESTCPGKMMGRSIREGGKALMGLAELMRVSAERCPTARCAIQLMGELSERHGFYGEEAGEVGAGESLTVVDGQEAWIFHILSGRHNTSSTWVAQRVPNDHVAIVANNFIIGNVRCADAENFLCGSWLFDNARKAGLCKFSDESEFHFSRCYGSDPRTSRYVAGMDPIPYYMTLRMWRVQSLANPDMNHVVTDDVYSYPFSVPVAKRVSRTDVMDWMRDQYQGTEFDMRYGELAGPFGNPHRLEGGEGMTTLKGNMPRAISIPRTTYGSLVESRPQAERSIVWLATDQPSTSVFVPFFARADRQAAVYRTGRPDVFTRDSAWWAFGLVSNWMNINYREMHTRAVGPAIVERQRHVVEEVRALEASWPEGKSGVDVAALNGLQEELQDATVQHWWALGERLIAQFNDGAYRTKEMNGETEAIGYPLWYLQMVGYSKDFFRPQFVQWAPLPPTALLTMLPQPLRLHVEAAATAMTTVMTAPPAGLLPGAVMGALVAFAPAFLLGRRRATPREGAKEYVRMP